MYEPIDTVISIIAIAIPVAFLILTRHWSARETLNWFFTAEQEARFFRKSIDDVRWARHHGCK